MTQLKPNYGSNYQKKLPTTLKITIYKSRIVRKLPNFSIYYRFLQFFNKIWENFWKKRKNSQKILIFDQFSINFLSNYQKKPLKFGPKITKIPGILVIGNYRHSYVVGKHFFQISPFTQKHFFLLLYIFIIKS